jgi:NhaA family Na+:H+ antiporter
MASRRHPAPLRPARIHRLTSPIRRFLDIEAASGVLLVACAAVAMALANSPLADAVAHFWHTPVTVGVGAWVLEKPLEWWVNDGLMTIFFFVVGLEIKREIVGGELRTLKRAALPVIGAVGGMLAPAVIYLAFGHDATARRGWGIPMATDIAFVVGVMALFGPRVPFGLKIFLLSLAIADDMGAVLVIAIAYTPDLNLAMLGLAASGFAFTVWLNWMGVRPVSVYVLVGAATWLATYKSGVHPTIAGVLFGLLTPHRPWISRDTLQLALTDLSGQLGVGHDLEELQPSDVAILRFAAREAVAPLQRLEDRLHPWVGFVIMPVFALANAGVAVDLGGLAHPVPMAVALALFAGKLAGILGFSFAAVKLGLAALPTGANWRMMTAAAVLGGIGFTMSIFVAGLAFAGHPELLSEAKAGILLGSLTSAVVGGGLLWWSLLKSESGG